MRVVGELLGAALRRVLPVYRASIPAVSFDVATCDASTALRTTRWDVQEWSYEDMNAAVLGGGNNRSQPRLCKRIRGGSRHACRALHLTPPLLRNLAALVVFDYLLWNYNRFRWRPPYTRHYTQNVFVRHGRMEPSASEAFAFIDNEFAAHSEQKHIRSSVCRTFPDYTRRASLKTYVQKSSVGV